MPDIRSNVPRWPAKKVGSLCHALESEESRTGAADAIRALVEAIVLEPDGERLKITLKGDLAGMLSAARDSKRSPDFRRPLGPNKPGCGGSQPTLSAALAARSLKPCDPPWEGHGWASRNRGLTIHSAHYPRAHAGARGHAGRSAAMGPFALSRRGPVAQFHQQFAEDSIVHRLD